MFKLLERLKILLIQINRTRLQSNAIYILYQAIHVAIHLFIHSFVHLLIQSLICTQQWHTVHRKHHKPKKRNEKKKHSYTSFESISISRVRNCTVRQSAGRVNRFGHKTSDCYAQNAIATLSSSEAFLSSPSLSLSIVSISFDTTSTLLLVFDLLLNVPILCLDAIKTMTN